MPTSQTSQNRIRVANPSIEGNQSTYLTTDTAVGGTTLNVLSADGFTLNDHGGAHFFVLIGNYGNERAEIVEITNQSATALTCGALLYSHSASDQITFVPYNQVSFYGMLTNALPNPTDAVLTTLNIDCSQLYTEYIYPGSTYSYFCTAYYNSHTTDISAFSDIITTSTFTRLSVKRVIDSGLRKAQTKIDERVGSQLNYDIALETVQDGVDEIFARKSKWSFLSKIDTTTTDTVAGVNYIDLPSDISKLNYIKVGGQKVNWFSKRDYQIYTETSNTVLPTGKPTRYTIFGRKVYFDLIPDSAYDVEWDYFARTTDITKLTDLVEEEFVVILIYYCASQFSYIRGNDKRGDKWYALFVKSLEQQVDEFTGPVQSGDAQYIERSSIYGENDEENILI